MTVGRYLCEGSAVDDGHCCCFTILSHAISRASVCVCVCVGGGGGGVGEGGD